MSVNKVLEKLLLNAKQSIQLGVEDYQLSIDDDKRKISAIRNFLAGLLLLYKYKLVHCARENEDPYMYIRIGNDRTVPPNKTIDVKGIKENLIALNIYIDAQKLDNLVSNRNKIEHFTMLNDIDISLLVFQSFHLFSEFYDNYIYPDNNLDLKDFIDSDIYEVLLENESVVLSRSKKFKERIENIDFPNNTILDMLKDSNEDRIKCPYCFSLMVKDIKREYESLELECEHCEKTFDIYDLLGVTHKAILDGDDPRSECPECYAFDVVGGVCLACGYELDPDRDYESEARMIYLFNKND